MKNGKIKELRYNQKVPKLRRLDNIRIEAITKVSITLLISSLLLACFFADNYFDSSKLLIPFIISTLASFSITKLGIKKIQNLELKQIIRKEGPKQHLEKSGTPTLGGILSIPAGLICAIFLTLDQIQGKKIIAVSIVTIGFMLIGLIDDWSAINQKRNSGLTPKDKIFLQMAIAILFLTFSGYLGWINSNISLPLSISLYLGVFIWPLTLFVFLAESNSTNLTDGLDGLATGCGAIVFTGMALQIIMGKNADNQILAIFCICMAGSWIGFLFHNRKPARIFMGDTGSLAMGASLSGVAILSDNLWSLFIMGGVFFIESISVILQVSIFKITKNVKGIGLRLFKMAPIHHHFELMGIKESYLVPTFWLINCFMVLTALFVISNN